MTVVRENNNLAWYYTYDNIFVTLYVENKKLNEFNRYCLLKTKILKFIRYKTKTTKLKYKD